MKGTKIKNYNKKNKKKDGWIIIQKAFLIKIKVLMSMMMKMKTKRLKFKQINY